MVYSKFVDGWLGDTYLEYLLQKTIVQIVQHADWHRTLYRNSKDARLATYNILFRVHVPRHVLVMFLMSASVRYIFFVGEGGRNRP